MAQFVMLDTRRHQLIGCRYKNYSDYNNGILTAFLFSFSERSDIPRVALNRSHYVVASPEAY